MNNKTISIIHPSRQRPEMALQTKQNWMRNAIHKNSIEYILSIDNNDPSLHDYNWHFRHQYDTKIEYNNNTSAMDAINVVAPKTVGNLIVVVSDDFDSFEGWDEYLITHLKGDKDFLVKTSDGYMNSDWLVTLPIMDREYYNRFGYVYHPEYKHLWCDTEMTTVGHMLGKIVDLQNSNAVFKHKHYTINGMEKDAVNEKNDATWNQGKSLFLERFDRDFDLKPEEIVKRFPKEKFI
jgi:hypothetical protein